MARPRTGHEILMAAVLVAVMLAVACLGLAPVLPDLPVGSQPAGVRVVGHALENPAHVGAIRSGFTGLFAALALGGSAVVTQLRAVSAHTARPLAPIGWHKLAAGLVPLPLRI